MELSDELRGRVNAFLKAGDILADEGQYDEAAHSFRDAWKLLPEPKTEWAEEVWEILFRLGDAEFLRGDYNACLDAFMTVAKHCGDAIANPFVRLRLGQCLYELGNRREAANWLAGSYLMEGKSIFEEEDPKYLEIIKSQLQPPPGGWPEGW